MSRSELSLYKIVQILMPAHRRKPKFVAWVKVFVSYLESIIKDLNEFWNRTVKEAIMTPQIVYLEWFLNQRYGTTTIKIVEGYNLGPWIYPHEIQVEHEFYLDQNDSFVYPSGIDVSVDFVVDVPSSLTDETSTIAALVQKYKLPGMSFIIQIIPD